MSLSERAENSLTCTGWRWRSMPAGPRTSFSTEEAMDACARAYNLSEIKYKKYNTPVVHGTVRSRDIRKTV